MKKVFVSAAFIIAIALSSCMDMGERVNGNGNIKSETRHINNASKIKLSGDMDVIVDPGPTSVRVESDDNVIPYIETKMDDGWLEIKTKDNANIHSSKGIKVYITTPNITDLDAMGSGNIKCNQRFSTDNTMTFNVTGSGDINADINAPKVAAQISGSGNLHISGDTKDVGVNIAGSGNFDAPQLKAENADVSISGSGDANVFADVKLKASIVGSGNIKYKGNAEVDKQVVGSGTVTKVQ